MGVERTPCYRTHTAIPLNFRGLASGRPAGYAYGAMKFTKMHGIGNDYVYVNGFEENVADPARLASRSPTVISASAATG